MKAASAVSADERSAPICADEPYSCLLHGIDTLEVSYFYDTSESGLDWDRLHFAKLNAAEAKRQRWTEMTLGQQDFFVLPFGAQLYSIILKNADFTILLGEKMTPNCRVKFSSEGLWRHGSVAQLERIDEWAKSLSLVPTRSPIVGRVDWAADFYVPEVDFKLDHFVSKAKKDREWRSDRRSQSFTFGKGGLVVRVYDKAAEIAEESAKSWFHQLWGRDDHVWRTEFQARRDYLKPHGIRTISDLFDLQGDAWREAAATHTSLRRPGKDSNRSRWPHHPLWASLLTLIDTQAQHGLVRTYDPQVANVWRLEQQAKALIGSAKGLAAMEAIVHGRTEPLSVTEFFYSRLPRLLLPRIDPKDWIDDVQAKKSCHRMGHR